MLPGQLREAVADAEAEGAKLRSDVAGHEAMKAALEARFRKEAAEAAEVQAAQHPRQLRPLQRQRDTEVAAAAAVIAEQR